MIKEYPYQGSFMHVLDWVTNVLVSWGQIALMIIALIVGTVYTTVHWYLHGDEDHVKFVQSQMYRTVEREVDFGQQTGAVAFTTIERNSAVQPLPFCTEPGDSAWNEDQEIRRANLDAGKMTFWKFGLSEKTWWLRRKSGKMYRSYVLAAMTITTMRQYLASFVNKDYTYHNTVCSAIEGDSVVTLSHAPRIGMTLAPKDISITDGYLIIGMWVSGRELPEDKLPDMHHNVADLKDSVLTPGQQAAVKALDAVRDPEFWVQAAHENGLNPNDDDMIYHRAEILRNFLDDRMPLQY